MQGSKVNLDAEKYRVKLLECVHHAPENWKDEGSFITW